MITQSALPMAGAVLLLAALVPVEAIKVPTSCYVPNGDPRTNHRPCYTDTADGHSHCCDPINEVCLDNGLCFAQGQTNPGYLYRDSCTDKTWGASSCPSPCRKTYTNSACPIVGILNPSQDSQFCCLSFNATANKCYGEDATFNVGKVIANWGPLEQVASASTASGTQSTASPTSAASSPAAATVTVKSTSSGHDAAIGAGVGIPLGILLVASLAGLFFQHRKHKKQLAQWQYGGQGRNVAGVGTQGGGTYPTAYQDPKVAYQHTPQPPPPQQAYEMPNVERTELA